MPRLTKSSKSEVTVAPVSVSPVVSVAASSADSVPTEPKKARRTVKPKSEAVVETKSSEPAASVVAESSSAPVSLSEQVDVAASSTLEEGEVDLGLTEQSVEFLSKLQQLGVLISSLKSEYRGLEKKWSRELKAANKLSLKRRRKTVNRAPSGFVKPTRISDELAHFLEKPSGSEMARTEVTRDINKYIRLHNLQDKDNGRKINPDSKLAALLKITGGEELTYFNLQRFMSPHFAKASKDLPVSVALAV
jgi:upstream activation factor subunit UAF30